MKQETYIINVSPPNMNNPITMHHEPKMEINNEAPRYNLKLHIQKKSPPNYKNPLQMSKCTPPFCDKMPKGNQNPSPKGGGGGDCLKCARSTRKAHISSSMSTKS